MVTLVAESPFAPKHSEPAQIAVEPQRDSTPTYRTHCPRCESMLSMNYDEPTCTSCGYVDYSYAPPYSLAAKKSVISTATRYIVRYVGDFPTLSETLAHVKLERVRNRVMYAVKCPFCDMQMVQSSLSGKRREIREERYKCEDGHRVSLTPGKNGSLGWK